MPHSLKDLPPLDLLRTFVAVGRRMSITLAAQDLCIVQSAVSRQIQGLEAVLDCRLFIRSYRRIEFTAEGRHLFECADSLLDQLSSVTAALRPRSKRPCITVTATIGVTTLWLLPRLGEFQRSNPDVDIRVLTTNRLVDLEREGVDLAVRFCSNASAPAGAVHLFNETLVPVAHPSLKAGAPDSPTRLHDAVLIEYDDSSRPWLQWKHWLRQSGHSSASQAGRRLLFNQYDQVVQAALAGQGIALGRLALVDTLIADGKLAIASSSPPVVTDYGYWLIEGDTGNAEMLLPVRRWIVSQAALTQAAIGCLT